MSKVLVDREDLEAVHNFLAHGGQAVAVLRWAENILAQPAEAEGMDRQRMIESMCLTWRHDFGLDKPADCQLSSGMTDTERNQLRDQMGKLFDHHFAPALSAVTAERDDEAESCEQWRALALQFDRHRMSALAHLKMVVAGQEGALDACRDFLAAPPVPGHEITAEIDQLRAEVEALRVDAERWRLYRQGFSKPDVLDANADAAMAAKEARDD